MIKVIEQNLQRGIRLLNAISDEEYSNCSIPPYHSSIGIQKETISGIKYFNEVITRLNSLDETTFNNIIKVTDDLGNGKVTVNYTIASALVQAHSHAIHHYALVGFIINQLGLELPEADFGYNPTTPKKVMAE